MKEYIYGERNGISIIDLEKTLRLFQEAVNFVSRLASQGKTVLFVGTKRQAQEAIQDAADRSQMYYINNRWLGGLLTNFSTVQHSIKRYKELDAMREDGFYDKLSKKEAASLERARKRLEKNLKGIREMDRLPDALFVVDSNHEIIAVKEAAKLDIPIISIVDTNCDPGPIDYAIPGNDDALRSIRLFTSTIAEAVLAGRSVYQAKVEAQLQVAQEKDAREQEARRKGRAERAAAKKRAEKEAQAAEASPKAASDTTPVVASPPKKEADQAETIATSEGTKKAVPKKAKASVEGKEAPASRTRAAAEQPKPEGEKTGAAKSPPAKKTKKKAQPASKDTAPKAEKTTAATKKKPTAKAKVAKKTTRSRAKTSGDSKSKTPPAGDKGET